MVFGTKFKRPAARVLRRHRAANGERRLEPPQIHRLLQAASPTLRAMLLLGVNCGFTNKDCADLPLSALDLDNGWLTFARPRTGVARRCPLWPETIAALRQAIAQRPAPRHPAATNRVFLTSRGRPYLTIGDDTGSRAIQISTITRRLMRQLGIHRRGLGFATLRHVFRTVADGARDHVACNAIMGHVDPSMAAVYRERIDDARLLAVAQHVRQWLYNKHNG